MTNTPTDKLLIILMEECGELVQACSKCLRFGYDADKLKALNAELIDILAVVEMLQKREVIYDWPELMLCIGEKQRKILMYDNISLTPYSDLYITKYAFPPPIDFDITYSDKNDQNLSEALYLYQALVRDSKYITNLPTFFDKLSYVVGCWGVDEQQMYDLLQCWREAGGVD